jgi:hypothetical protein
MRQLAILIALVVLQAAVCIRVIVIIFRSGFWSTDTFLNSFYALSVGVFGAALLTALW